MYFFFILFSFALLLIYAILIIIFYIAWKKYPAFETTINTKNLFISIIIPARNEESHISNILSDVVVQDFEQSGFEVFVVNDHSEDNTLAIAEKFKEKHKNLNILDLPGNVYGKKQALASAISKVKGKLIITVDADCRVGKHWLSAFASFYYLHKPKLIIGPILYSGEKSLLEQMQSIEIMGLVASGASASILNHPIMCNGANLAFTKEAYLETASNLKPELASGDDLFLLLSVKQKWPKEIRFLKSEKALAFTNAAPDIKSFLSQHKRWTSKSRHYNDLDIISVAVLVFITNLAISLSFFLGLFLSYFFIWFAILLIIKSLADLFLLNSYAKFFEKKIILKYIWLAQIIYPFFIVYMAIYGNVGKFKWKNRVYR